jgi:hypothetical protein
MAAVWQRNMRERIIPNSRRMLATLEANKDYMIDGEARTLELFRQHIHDLEARHFADVVDGQQRRFPREMENMMRTA